MNGVIPATASTANNNSSTDVIAIILVNWNGWQDTIACLESLKQSKVDEGLRIVVVDNCSSDESTAQISSWMESQGALTWLGADVAAHHAGTRVDRIADVHTDTARSISLICNQDNFGFAAANNIGMQYAMSRYGANYFWILNNDTLVCPDTLSLLVARMMRDPSIGICGATLLYCHAPDIVQAYGGVNFSVVTARGHHLGGGERYGGPLDNETVERQLTYVSGASMLVSRAFLDQIGPMCEDYFLYCEELDWAWRARGRFRLGVETAAVVYHKEGATIGTESRDRPPSLLSEFYQARNRLRFAWRHTPWFLPTVWTFLLLRTIKRLRHGRIANAQVMLLAMFGSQQPKNEWFPVRSS